MDKGSPGGTRGDSPVASRRGARGRVTEVQYSACPSSRFFEFVLWGLLLGTLAGTWAYGYLNETIATCVNIAVSTMMQLVTESACKVNPRNDGRLVRMTCLLVHGGATDKGTGLYTSGYGLQVHSMMLQYKMRLLPLGNGEAGTCVCFEKVWETYHVELSEDLKWSPDLCSHRRVSTVGLCQGHWPGLNPRLPPVADTDRHSLNSLGVYTTYAQDARLGTDGIHIGVLGLQFITDDVLRPDQLPLLHFSKEARISNSKFAGYNWLPHVLHKGNLGSSFQELNSWIHFDCSSSSVVSPDAHFLFKPNMLKPPGAGQADPDPFGQILWEPPDYERMIAQRWWLGNVTEAAKRSNGCDKPPEQIGDRILSIKAHGAKYVTAVGVQNGTGADGRPNLVPFDFDALPATGHPACNLEDDGRQIQMFYAGKADSEHPNSASDVFAWATRNATFEVIGVRTLTFSLDLAAVSGHTLFLRCLSCSPSARVGSYRAALHGLPCCSVLGYVLLLTIALWLMPILVTWAIFPDIFLKLLLLEILVALLARWMVYYGASRYERLLEEAAAAAGAPTLRALGANLRGSGGSACSFDSDLSEDRMDRAEAGRAPVKSISIPLALM